MAPRYRFDLALHLTLGAVACFCFGSSKAQAAGNYSDLSVLRLPDPKLVNDFLLDRYSNWTNPVLGGQEPQPLQVIKCQSLPLGVTFDFYQVQAPGKACELPPPLVSSIEHRKHMVSAKIDWLIYFYVYLSLEWGLTFAAFLSLVVLFPVVFLIVSLGHILAGKGSKPVTKEAFRPYAWLFIAALFALGVAIASLTGSAAHCLWPKTWIEYKGPVNLPDPNQGLNQYLASKLGEDSVDLQLCTTDNLAFYIGFQASCARVGEPYGELKPDLQKAEHDAHPCSEDNKKLLFLCLVLGAIGTGSMLLFAAEKGFCIVMKNSKIRSFNFNLNKPRVTPVSSSREDEADEI